MRGLITVLMMLIVAQANAAEQLISVQHDSQRGVTCWIVNNTGISCLPDSSLPQTAESTREAGRASPASTEHETGRLQPVSLPQEERFAL